MELKYLCLCETDIPMSVGIVEPKTHPSQLNAAEFLWDMNKRTSVFVQVTHKRIISLLCHLLGVPLNFHITRIY